MRRRTLLSAIGAASVSASAWAANGRQRVVIVGGGWAGLSAARQLRHSAPELDVLVIDREPALHALPLSNPWLVGHTGLRLAPLDLTKLAQAHGYRFVPATVETIDRAQRQVHTTQGRFEYDWMLLAAGVGYDYEAWFGQDHRAASQARGQFPAGFLASELDLLKRRLEEFQGGDLVMTVPPPPYRCPPAPYERAMMVGWWLKTRRIKAKLTVLDAGGGLGRFTRLFAERYPDQIDYRPHTVIRSVDPFARTLSTEEGDLRFAHAMLLPPMRANALVAQSGLLGRDAPGAPSRWAVVDPMKLVSPADERIYLAGDLLDSVSPLFGHYPKTAHIAAGLGAAAAQQIVARSRDLSPAPGALPQSICHVWLDAEPAEQMRLEAQYRLRGDGLIMQTVRQIDNPQPRDEDLQWARALMAGQLGAPTP